MTVQRRVAAVPLILLSLCFLPAPAMADARSLKASAFASLITGSVLEGDRKEALTADIECPCVVTDWSNRGVYQGRDWTARPDSKAGVQLDFQASVQWSMTAQATVRGMDSDPNTEWAYASWKPTSNWQIDAGRKRIPLYYYSEFQDVGLAYPWNTPPGELYGWESNNYTGASVQYTFSVGDNEDAGLAIRARLLGGSDEVKDNPYVATWSDVPTDTRWKNLRGGDLEISQDNWTTRLVYLRTNVEYENVVDGLTHQNMQAYGIAFNLTLNDDWTLLTEAGMNDRDYKESAYRVFAPAFSVGAGYRIDDHWSTFANLSQYREFSHDPSYAYVRYRSQTVTLQYMINRYHGFKLQLDNHDDFSQDYSGDARLVRLSYDIAVWSGNLLQRY